MKTQTVFKNSSLVSVVNGSIVVKDSTEREHTFTNASIVSVNNGTIIIESEWEPKKGELVKIPNSAIEAYCIINRIESNQICVFGWKKIDDNQHCLERDYWMRCSTTKISPVTPEEQKKFDDFCKSQGKIWNKEILQWEKYKWMPVEDQEYYTVFGDGLVYKCLWNTSKVARDRYALGNCFETKEQAQKAAEKLKEFFKSL